MKWASYQGHGLCRLIRITTDWAPGKGDISDLELENKDDVLASVCELVKSQLVDSIICILAALWQDTIFYVF